MLNTGHINGWLFATLGLLGPQRYPNLGKRKTCSPDCQFIVWGAWRIGCGISLDSLVRVSKMPSCPELSHGFLQGDIGRSLRPPQKLVGFGTRLPQRPQLGASSKNPKHQTCCSQLVGPWPSWLTRPKRHVSFGRAVGDPSDLRVLSVGIVVLSLSACCSRHVAKYFVDPRRGEVGSREGCEVKLESEGPLQLVKKKEFQNGAAMLCIVHIS